jgi:uncharacterized protein (DUF58 family)
MAQVTQALTPAAVAKLTTMQLRARAIVEGHFSGQHRSPYRGASVEFADHREYTPGDETRHIDWKVYGRRDRFFVKEYDAETNLNVHLMVDVSGSMNYGAPVRKLEYAAYLAAGLAYLATHQRDATGLLLFDHRLRLQLPPHTKPAHLQRIFDSLDALCQGALPPADDDLSRETDLTTALEAATPTITRRGLVVVISDLLDDLDRVLRALAYLRHRGHDVMVLQVMDAEELEFRFRGPALFEDLETGQRLAAQPEQLRRDYLRALHDFLAQVRDGCRKLAIDQELLNTSRPFDQALTAYLGRRNRAR